MNIMQGKEGRNFFYLVISYFIDTKQSTNSHLGILIYIKT